MNRGALPLVFAPLFATPQTSPVQQTVLTQGSNLYANRCAVCHGEDYHGTDQGPALAGNRRVRRRSLEQLSNLIRNGVPASGMPAFSLPAEQLQAVAAFVRSLNSPAAESMVLGDATAGKQLFFGSGRCMSCHMVNGTGAALGPDLSNIGREMTVDEIRQALLKPSAQIAPGYELAIVELWDGRSLRGFSRTRNNFGMVLQDLHGHFYSLQHAQIAAVEIESGSLMPSVIVSAQKLRNLTAYLSSLTGEAPGARPVSGPSEKSDFRFNRIEDPKPGDWPTYNGKLSGNRYSELTEINTNNVKQLGVQWMFSVPYAGLETTPIVADGVMYVTAANQAYALDAGTGMMIWQYSRPRTQGLVGDASLGTNRGAAILGDKIFMVTDNAHLIALNRTTGSLVWETVIPDEPQHYGSTVAPLIVNDLVVAGVSGGDWGIRGFVTAFKADTGERVWRYWTIPQKGEQGYDTWKGKDPEFGGGSTWLTGSYDSETGTLFWPTGNPYPDSDDRYRGGDNLFTDCVLALNPATGTLKWHYQFTPHDVHDWDSTEPAVLVDTLYRGAQRKLLLHADRNGFFYVLDRTNGELLLAKPFIRRLTWASGIGPNGRPVLSLAKDGKNSGVICPAEEAINWNATAFSPRTHLFYVMAIEKCKVTSPANWKVKPPEVEPAQKVLRAIDIETGRIVWEKPQLGSTRVKTWAGVLGTAGGILFYGDPGGAFVAADERNGDPLWHFSTNGVIKASPMTYTAGGKQFVAIAAGSNIVAFGLRR